MYRKSFGMYNIGDGPISANEIDVMMKHMINCTFLGIFLQAYGTNKAANT